MNELEETKAILEATREQIKLNEHEIRKLKNKYRALENEFVFLSSLIETVEDVLDGKSVSDFMESFPMVEKAVRVAKHCKRCEMTTRNETLGECFNIEVSEAVPNGTVVLMPSKIELPIYFGETEQEALERCIGENPEKFAIIKDVGQ